MKDIMAMAQQAKPCIPAHYELSLKKVGAPFSYDNEYGEGHYELSIGDPILEGTRKEHWSPTWPKIVKKYLTLDGEKVEPEQLPFDVWVRVQTHPDREVRKNALVWALPAKAVSEQPFTVGELAFDPNVDMVCIGGDETGPNFEWGVWPVKAEIFEDTYEAL